LVQAIGPWWDEYAPVRTLLLEWADRYQLRAEWVLEMDLDMRLQWNWQWVVFDYFHRSWTRAMNKTAEKRRRGRSAYVRAARAEEQHLRERRDKRSHELADRRFLTATSARAGTV
jgi:hypothetical protein